MLALSRLFLGTPRAKVSFILRVKSGLISRALAGRIVDYVVAMIEAEAGVSAA